MNDTFAKTGERVIPENFESIEEYLCYLRHLKAYEITREHLSSDVSVLEIGCGEGYGTNFLAKHVREIIGLDIDESVVRYTSKKYSSGNCTFQLYDGMNLPFERETFGAVVSFQVIEHIENDHGYVSDVFRVLKNGGVFILTTPNRTYRLKPGQKPWNEFHIREYYSHELELVLRSAFSDVKVWGIKGTKEVQDIEIERIRKGLNSLDPYNLKKFIPKPIRPIVARLLRKITGRELKSTGLEQSFNKYSTNDFYLIKDNLEDSLDLLGKCIKIENSAASD